MKDASQTPYTRCYASGAGQLYTRKGNGRCYDTVGLEELTAMVKSPPPAAPKGKGRWRFPSTYTAETPVGRSRNGTAASSASWSSTSTRAT